MTGRFGTICGIIYNGFPAGRNPDMQGIIVKSADMADSIHGIFGKVGAVGSGGQKQTEIQQNKRGQQKY